MTSQMINELMVDLLNKNLVYRYHPQRFNALDGKGLPFPSPVREINTSQGKMIEEVIQPVLEPIAITSNQHQELIKVAAAWPKFLQTQLEIFKQAKEGKLNPTHTALIISICTAEEWESGLLEPGYDIIHPFIRLDALLTPEGFKVVDINSTRPAGAGDIINHQKVLDSIFLNGLNRPDMSDSFIKIVKICLDQWSSSKKLPGESIPFNVVARETDGDWHNFNALHQTLLGAGLSSFLVKPEQLNGDASAILRSRIKEGDPAYDLLKKGYPDNRCILSPLYRRFLGNKLWMYAYRLPGLKEIFTEKMGESYEVLNKIFPKIGLTKNGCVCFPNEESQELTSLDRKEWVIKDPASSSGRRMILGISMSREKWWGSLPGIKDNWIVQRIYKAVQKLQVADQKGELKPTKLFTKYGIYIFGQSLAGLEFNARRSPLVHGARDTYFNSVYVQN